MKICKTVINGFDWLVSFETSVTDALFQKNGYCSYEEHHIYIWDSLSPQIKRSTLIHELTHAFEYQHGLRDRASENKHEDLAEFVGLYGSQIVQMADELLEEIAV